MGICAGLPTFVQQTYQLDKQVVEDKPSYSFKKHERLKSRKRMAEVFASNRKLAAYPLLLMYLPLAQEAKAPIEVAFSVSSRKFRKATQRNKIKRLMREAWRLDKHLWYENLAQKKESYAFVFVFIGKDNDAAFRQMQKALRKLRGKFFGGKTSSKKCAY